MCAVTTIDTAWCWGRGIEVEAIATGFFFTCLKRKNGAVACTGANELGQLGLGDTNRRDVPQNQ